MTTTNKDSTVSLMLTGVVNLKLTGIGALTRLYFLTSDAPTISLVYYCFPLATSPHVTSDPFGLLLGSQDTGRSLRLTYVTDVH